MARTVTSCSLRSCCGCSSWRLAWPQRWQFFTGEEFFQHAFPHRALGPGPLAQAARRQTGVVAGREPAGGARGRCVTRPDAGGSRSIRRCSRRPSAFRPMPICCMRPSRGSTAWRPGTASGCGNHILACQRYKFLHDRTHGVRGQASQQVAQGVSPEGSKDAV